MKVAESGHYNSNSHQTLPSPKSTQKGCTRRQISPFLATSKVCYVAVAKIVLK